MYLHVNRLGVGYDLLFCRRSLGEGWGNDNSRQHCQEYDFHVSPR
jgi:hypothetical protein